MMESRSARRSIWPGLSTILAGAVGFMLYALSDLPCLDNMPIKIVGSILLLYSAVMFCLIQVTPRSSSERDLRIARSFGVQNVAVAIFLLVPAVRQLGSLLNELWPKV